MDKMKRLQCIQLIIWAIEQQQQQQQQQQQKNGIDLHSFVQIVENMVGIVKWLSHYIWFQCLSVKSLSPKDCFSPQEIFGNIWRHFNSLGYSNGGSLKNVLRVKARVLVNVL